MRNFVYFSEAKVDSLHSRIPKDLLVTLTLELKSKPDGAGLSDRFLKALAAERQLEFQGEFSSGFEERRDYFRGTHPLSFGVAEDYSQQLAYFGGQTGTTWVFLIGAREGLIGESEPVTTGGRLDSKSPLTHHGLKTMNQLLRSEEAGNLQAALQGFDPQLVLGLRQGASLFPAPGAPLHYVAKTLHRVRTKDDLFVLGTPVYVSSAPAAAGEKGGKSGGGWLGKLFGR